MLEGYSITNRDTGSMSPVLLENDLVRARWKATFHIEGRIDSRAGRLDFHDLLRPVHCQHLERRAHSLNVRDTFERRNRSDVIVG